MIEDRAEQTPADGGVAEDETATDAALLAEIDASLQQLAAEDPSPETQAYVEGVRRHLLARNLGLAAAALLGIGVAVAAHKAGPRRLREATDSLWKAGRALALHGRGHVDV